MLISQENLSLVIAEQKSQGKKIVFTNGCFDIIHSGHVIYLSQAKQLGDILIIGLNTDSSVSELKGPGRPVNNQIDRAIVLSALKSVDFVVFFEEDTPYNLIKLLQPDVLVKGGDYTVENIVGADIVRQNGGEVKIIPLVQGKSTSNIIEKINSD
jgi:D-beta-D-heptose 7-phosphate kinase/D-beta-D-heptose 1-phosphate adenosyltransferase